MSKNTMEIVRFILLAALIIGIGFLELEIRTNRQTGIGNRQVICATLSRQPDGTDDPAYKEHC